MKTFLNSEASFSRVLRASSAPSSSFSSSFLGFFSLDIVPGSFDSI